MNINGPTSSPDKNGWGHLTKNTGAKAGKLHALPTGMCWAACKKEGFLEKFTYAEFRMKDATVKHLVSARLQPHPVVYGQPEEIVSIAFSADPAQLENCAFMIVACGSSRGDVGCVLKVKDFLVVKKTGE